MKWINSVGGEILQKKKIKVKDYCIDLQEMCTPVDQIGLLILARMYHRHFTVYLKNGVWSTRRDNGIHDSVICFFYNSSSWFSDTFVDPEAGEYNDPRQSHSDAQIEVLDDSLNLAQPHAAKCTSPPPISRLPNDSESTSLSESPSLSDQDDSKEPPSQQSGLKPEPQPRASYGESKSTLLSKSP